MSDGPMIVKPLRWHVMVSGPYRDRLWVGHFCLGARKDEASMGAIIAEAGNLEGDEMLTRAAAETEAKRRGLARLRATVAELEGS